MDLLGNKRGDSIFSFQQFVEKEMSLICLRRILLSDYLESTDCSANVRDLLQKHIDNGTTPEKDERLGVLRAIQNMCDRIGRVDVNLVDDGGVAEWVIEYSTPVFYSDQDEISRDDLNTWIISVEFVLDSGVPADLLDKSKIMFRVE